MRDFLEQPRGMNLEDLQRQAQEDISRVQSTEELQQVKAKYLGKKGLITLAIKDIANIHRSRGESTAQG
jgi:phenylalanyl-tRNA synthetase alpha subunit